MLAVIVGRRRTGKSTLALALAKAREQTVIVFDPNSQYGNIPIIENLEEWMTKAGADSIGRIIPQSPLDDFDILAETLDGGSWRWGEYTLILDECSMLMSPHKINPALERYARTCPKDVHIILTTHRAIDVHSLFRALASDWYVFHQTLPRDLDLLSEAFGQEFSDSTRALPRYHLSHFWLGPGGEPVFAVWNRPDLWYIDIGRTT